MENTAEKYLLVIEGKPQGPFSTAEMRSLGLKPGDFVKSTGMADYKEAHEVAELRALFNFARPHVEPQYFAGFDQRLMASALDWFMVSGVCIFILFIALIFASKEQRVIEAISCAAIIPVVKFIYHIIMECSPMQATYGKRILKIKVCDMHGERIGAGRSLGRNLGKLFSSAMFFLGYLISFFNRKHQCLHDMLADTLVIKDRLI